MAKGIIAGAAVCLAVANFAAACLAVMTVGVAADPMTYEGRGYGGPLGVGPNFRSSEPSKPKHYRKRTYKKRAKARPSKRTETAKSAPEADVPVKKTDNEKTDNEKTVTKDAVSQNSSIATSAATPSQPSVRETGTTAATEPQSTSVGCKRFIASVGETVTVPCD
jgi:hypothetical protein